MAHTLRQPPPPFLCVNLSLRRLFPPKLPSAPPQPTGRRFFFYRCSPQPKPTIFPPRPSSTLRAFSAAAEAVREAVELDSIGGGKEGKSYFYEDEGVSWESLGISDRLARALHNASLHQPSLIQAASIPKVLTGKDVIIAAETGSGKTHCYLIPMIEKLFAGSDPCKSLDNHEESYRQQNMFLVLCPNVMLCEQVAHMANCLLDNLGHPIVKVAAVCGCHGWPIAQPDILVSTPAALLNYLFDFDPEKRRRARSQPSHPSSRHCAATLPGNGKKTAGAMLKRMFPDALWTSVDFLHRHNPRLEQIWIEVTPVTQVDALIDAVNYHHRSEAQESKVGSASRIMVFTNTVDAAQSVAKILGRVGLGYTLYHSASSLEEQKSNLNTFRENGGILVFTDAAARGLDIPNISHVIQAEFAASAVDFLHKVGRTARAGQTGTVTSLYIKSDRDLVYAVREAERMNEQVEKASSRNRSFRSKLKKIGCLCC